MPFKNLTFLPCLPFDAKPPSGACRDVVIVKATLDLLPAHPALKAHGFSHYLKVSPDQQPLVFTDLHWGESQASSLRWESDLAPAKPRCDVIVLGSAHAPAGKPRRRWMAGLRLKVADRDRPQPDPPEPLNAWMDLTEGQKCEWAEAIAWAEANPIQGEVLLDKRLRVTGPRWLLRRRLPSRTLRWLLKVATLGLVRPCPWRLTGPERATSVPMRYEHSFGGHIRVGPSDPEFHRVPRKHWLPGADRKALAASGTGILAEAWWGENPAGCGYAPSWEFKAARLKRLPAPQIEDPRHRFTAKAAWAASRGCKRILPCLLPQGLGPIYRSWASRLKLVGSWSEAWNESGAPYFPGFQEAFWNVAHPDLQCRHLEGAEVLELTNLCSPQTPGLFRDARRNGVLRFALPGLFPYLLLRFAAGRLEHVPALLDTVILEPDAARVTLLFRAGYPSELEPDLVELGVTMLADFLEPPFHSTGLVPPGADARTPDILTYPFGTES